MHRPFVFIGLLALGLACAGAPTPEPVIAPPQPTEVAKASRCGGAFERIDHWSGEYPTPVVAVVSGVEVPARADPCDVETSLSCTLPVRLFHPWATPPSPGFATLAEQMDFRVKKAFEQKDVEEKLTWTLSPGDIVRVTAYFSEGVCALKWGEQTMEGYCPMQDDNFEAVDPAADGSRNAQLFQVDCGGQPGWVEVEDSLFAREGIEKGTVTGYGTVGPPGDPNSFIE